MNPPAGVTEAVAKLTDALKRPWSATTANGPGASSTPVRANWAESGALDSEARRVIDAYLDICLPHDGGCDYRIDRTSFQVAFV